jgi:ABC-type microcin C transport system permease subunit YejB
MGAYIIRRLLLIIPTLLGIMLLNFIIIHNWLQVLGATELAQIDQRVRHQFHAIVPLLDTFKS